MGGGEGVWETLCYGLRGGRAFLGATEGGM